MNKDNGFKTEYEFTDEEKAYLLKKRARRKRQRLIKNVIRLNFALMGIIGIILFVRVIFNGALANASGENVKVPVPILERETVKKDSTAEGENTAEGEMPEYPKIPDRTPESITVIVNKKFRLPSDYVPGDLTVPDVEFTLYHMDDRKKLRNEAAKALEELFAGAKKDDISLIAVSGYRSFERQAEIYSGNVSSKGIEEASAVSAPPGGSEHQTGLTMDVSSNSNYFDLTERFGKLPEGKWLAKHAHEYGFIIRYPKDKEKITGYSYEPWHIRYVGKDLAEFLYSEGITLDEYYGVSAEN